MAFLPKGCVSGGYGAHVSIGIVTNPWKAAPNSPEQPRQTTRQPAGSRTQHPDSVSETLRISDMVAPRKIPPGSGWRKFIFNSSFHPINLVEPPAERHYREFQGRIRRHIRKQYVSGVVSGKGGVGKTTLRACIGA